MAYLRPPAFQRRVFNELAMRFGIGGSETLVVRGRRSGEPRRIPVIPIEVDGSRYLVSTRGESEWVRNLRAAGLEGELRSRSGSKPFTASEVPVGERQPIIEVYKQKNGRMVQGYFSKLPDPIDHPVFRVDVQR